MLAAFVGLGVAQQAMGQTQEAMASFETAATVEPNSSLLFAETCKQYLKANIATAASYFDDGCCKIGSMRIQNCFSRFSMTLAS